MENDSNLSHLNKEFKDLEEKPKRKPGRPKGSKNFLNTKAKEYRKALPDEYVLVIMPD